MIAIIDYKAGNLASVSNALTRLKADFIVTNTVSELDKASKIIFPGVGHAWAAMEALRAHNLDQWLRTTRKPVLGICLGMQLLYETSDEGGGTEGLGLIPGHLKRFDETAGKVPHMGWNDIHPHTGEELATRAVSPDKTDFSDPLLFGSEPSSGAPVASELSYQVYFVHSYYAPVNRFTTATCIYNGVPFAAAVKRGNYAGVQFHPEKSGEAGINILKKFVFNMK